MIFHTNKKYTARKIHMGHKIFYIHDMSLQALRIWSRCAKICSTEGWSFSNGFTMGVCWTLL